MVDGTQTGPEGQAMPASKGAAMKTLRRWLIVTGMFVLAYNVSQIVHELGHMVTSVATGGQLGSIEISPLSWSYAHVTSPEPMAMFWCGSLWQVVFGVLVFLILWVLKSRLSLFGLVLAVVSLGDAGIYFIGGTISGYGDPANLAGRGIPRAALIGIGTALVLPVLLVALPAGGLLGIGRGRCRLRTTLLVLSPIGLYLVVMVAYNVISGQPDWAVWLAEGAGGLVLWALAGLLIHWSAGWLNGPEVQRRSVPVNWRWAVGCILLAGGLVAGEVALLGPQPSMMPQFPAHVRLTWFQDAEHYAGVSGWSARDGQRVGEVFWRIGPETGRTPTEGVPWWAEWSQAIGRLVVVTGEGVFTLLPPGKPEVIARQWGAGPFAALSPDGARLVTSGSDITPPFGFVLAVDLPSGRAGVHRLDGFSRPPVVSLSSDSTVVQTVAFSKEEPYRQSASDWVKAVWDASAGWRFETQPAPKPDGRILGAYMGQVVWEPSEGVEGGPAATEIRWGEHVAPAPSVWPVVFSWRGKLLAPGPDNCMLQMTPAGRLEVLAGSRRGDTVGRGVCADGVWLAYPDGLVRIIGDSERTAKVELPAPGPP